MKRFWTLLLFFVCACPATQMDDPDYLKRLLEFHVHYNQFYRAILGCPKDAASLSDCNPKLGTPDYGAYMRAAKLSRKVFP